jgi:hypothetical protein
VDIRGLMVVARRQHSRGYRSFRLRAQHYSATTRIVLLITATIQHEHGNPSAETVDSDAGAE